MNSLDFINASRLLQDAFGQDIEITERENLDLDWAPVERWHIGNCSDKVPRSVVVKTRRHGETGWGGHPLNLVTERRALSTLNGSGFTPNMVAYDDDHGVIIMEDMHPAVTVERLLFGGDKIAATEALIETARVTGSINGSTVGIEQGIWNPEANVLNYLVSNFESVNHLLHAHRFLRINISPMEIKEIQHLIRMEAMQSLTHWDVNPSNAMTNGDRLVIIDFESANPGHMAIDGAGFALGFAHYRYWARLEDEIVDGMSDVWTEGVIATWPEAPNRSEMLRHIAAAAICKTLERLTRLTRIVDPDQPGGEAMRRRSQIVDNLRRTAQCCERANSFLRWAESMCELEMQMRERWPESAEGLSFPAFNGGNRDGWSIYHPI